MMPSIKHSWPAPLFDRKWMSTTACPTASETEYRKHGATLPRPSVDKSISNAAFAQACKAPSHAGQPKLLSA
jgi:hypothetical protein